MHAVLMTVEIEAVEIDGAQKSLREEIIPMVSAAPGFVAGYWLEPRDGQGVSLVVFESEEQARQTASVEFRGITASA
jgi:hypothetical protein